ncbi:MAG TPA: 3-isopropylmalate dehydratase small subunit [Acidobacteriota bacterium]|nr:3-isopropylmalate dehydratase small subunit [Acidobacteriota bacterium]
MQKKITGRVFKYGDDINTDVIFPGKYTYTVSDPAEMGRHALEDLDPQFVKQVKPGDVIVAGKNFGCGSSREQAAVCLVAVGLGGVIARSFGRIYFRNALNQGLMIAECPEAVDALEAGDEVTIDLERGEVITPRGTFNFPPPPQEVMHIIEAGGLVPYVRGKLGIGE